MKLSFQTPFQNPICPLVSLLFALWSFYSGRHSIGQTVYVAIFSYLVAFVFHIGIHMGYIDSEDNKKSNAMYNKYRSRE